MLGKLFLCKTLLKKTNTFFLFPKKAYHPVRELMKKKSALFYADPNVVAEDIVRIVVLHDKIKDPNMVTMGAKWEEMGLDSLDYVDILSEIEFEYGYDFGPTEWEQFLNINDVAQFMAKDYFAQKH